MNKIITTKHEVFASNAGERPEPEPGQSVWIEEGRWFSAATVAGDGKHDYGKRGIGKCPCGCYMGGFSSNGPVDPFGPCPGRKEDAK